MIEGEKKSLRKEFSIKKMLLKVLCMALIGGLIDKDKKLA